MRYVLALALLFLSAGVARAETPVDVPAAWREREAAIGLPELPADYHEVREHGVRWALPKSALTRESRAVREAFPGAWRIVAEDLGLGDEIPELHIRLTLNPAHLRALSPRGAPAPEFAVGVAYPSLGLALVSLSAEAPATDLDPVAVLTHELSHVALRLAVEGQPLPRWLVEGLAIEHAKENNLRRITTLFAAASTEGLLPLRALDSGFSPTSHRVNEAYAQSADLVRYLRAQSPRPETFGELLTRVREGAPFEEALLETYGFDIESLERAWLNDLRRRYPSISIEAVMSLGWIVAALLVFAAFVSRRRKKKRRLAEMAAREEREEAALRAQAEREAAERRALFMLEEERGEPGHEGDQD